MSSYAAYHHWANQKLTEQILTLTEEHHHREIASSFSSLYKTVLHLWQAESIWWQRMKLQENIVVPGLSLHPAMQEAVNGLLKQDKDWQEWVEQASQLQMEHEFSYQNSKKEKFRQPVWQMLLHMFNHGTYHRGQLVTMLRQLGEDKIAQTDYIHYSRNKK